MYKYGAFGEIVRIADGAIITHDPSNMDCAAYLAWLAAGNTPLPYVPDPAEAQAALKAVAQTALDKSDTTLMRCYEAGVAVPAEWATYRGQLRGIVSGNSSATELPVRPEYPAGT